MSTFRLVAIILVGTISSPSFAFDLGAFGRGFNSAQEGNAGSNDANERLVEYFAKKVDNGEELFVTESTRKSRLVDSFERAMKDSELTPSYKYQTTNPIKVVIGAITFYEQWSAVLFRNKSHGDAEELSANRWFIFCDKGILGESGSVHFSMNEGQRIVRAYLLTLAFRAAEFRGPERANYDSVCQVSDQQIREAMPDATPRQ